MKPNNYAGFLPKELGKLKNPQTDIPRIAKDASITRKIEGLVQSVPTTHSLSLCDSRNSDVLNGETIHLAITSPPYWTLKKYPKRKGQLGVIDDYEEFLAELDKVWENVFRALIPGGRLVIVVGDVCLARRTHGRHRVVPLHGSIQEHCRRIGFDNLAPIIWYKIANAAYEVENGSSFLGKPYEPNAILKNDIEYILMQRKPGGYRQPDLEKRILSVIPEENYRMWFQQIWQLPGSSTKDHPAPFSLNLAERLVRMFSFVGDTVLDPFMGTGTTNIASAKWGRNSIGLEIDPHYLDFARKRMEKECRNLFSNITIEVKR